MNSKISYLYIYISLHINNYNNMQVEYMFIISRIIRFISGIQHIQLTKHMVIIVLMIIDLFIYLRF